MRFFVPSVTIGALLLSSLAGQPLENEEASDSWEGLLRESAELETRLGLGLVSAGETKDAVRILIAEGDKLLKTYSGSKDGGDGLATAMKAVLSATSNAVETVMEAKTRLVAAETPQGVAIDPWAGTDQECGFVPERLGRVRLRNGDLLPEVDQGEFPGLVPPRYRLAEALGLGYNRAVCEPRFIDPIQVEHPSHQAGGGVDVVARFYCELTGQFVQGTVPGKDDTSLASPAQTSSEGSGSHRGEGDSSSSPPEETFRVVVISRGRRGAGYNRMNAAFEQRNDYGVWDNSLALKIRNGTIRNPWVNEALPAAAAERGWLIEPLRVEEGTRKSWTRDVLREKLEALKRQVVQGLRRDALVRDRLGALRKSLEDYQSAIHEALANGGDTGEFIVAAELGLQAINLGALVESGQLDDAVLRRIVPATGLALDATLRALQVAKTPHKQRGKAAAVAETLNSLARWTPH